MREDVGEEIGGLLQCREYCRVLAVSRQVDGHHLVRSCQNGPELMCRVLGLREAVEPYEQWARAATLDTEE